MFQNQEDESNETPSVSNKGISAMKAASQIAIQNGQADMTLDEINARERLAWSSTAIK